MAGAKQTRAVCGPSPLAKLRPSQLEALRRLKAEIAKRFASGADRTAIIDCGVAK